MRAGKRDRELAGFRHAIHLMAWLPLNHLLTCDATGCFSAPRTASTNLAHGGIIRVIGKPGLSAEFVEHLTFKLVQADTWTGSRNSTPAGTWPAARTTTIRTRRINVAARLAHRARTIHLYLPEHWLWQAAFDNLFTAVHPTPG